MDPEFADIIHTGSCATFLRTAAVFHIYLFYRSEGISKKSFTDAVYWVYSGIIFFGSRLPEIEREYRNELFREAETGNLLQR